MEAELNSFKKELSQTEEDLVNFDELKSQIYLYKFNLSFIIE